MLPTEIIRLKVTNQLFPITHLMMCVARALSIFIESVIDNTCTSHEQSLPLYNQR